MKEPPADPRQNSTSGGQIRGRARAAGLIYTEVITAQDPTVATCSNWGAALPVQLSEFYFAGPGLRATLSPLAWARIEREPTRGHLIGTTSL